MGNLGVTFEPTANSTEVLFTATATTGQIRDDLSGLLGEGEGIQDSWDFVIAGLSGGDDVMLSFALAGEVGADDLTIWHYDEATSWTVFDATDLVVTGGSANFTVNSFSSYAVTGPTEVPEPSTLVLFGLAMIGLALLRRRWS